MDDGTAAAEGHATALAAPCRLSLGLGVLEHLSGGLYSSLAAVLTESLSGKLVKEVE